MVSSGTRHMTTGGRYPILRTIAILWLVGAVLTGIYGIYQAICALSNARSLEVLAVGGNWTSRIVAFFVWLAATFFAVLINVGIAEVIKLFIDVEHSTRMTALNTTAIPNAPCSLEGIRDDGANRFVSESAESALIRGH